MSKVVYEGWMVRYDRRKIDRSFIHMRYSVLKTRVLAYYKRKPPGKMVPIKTLFIGGNFRVEDRGLNIHNGHMVYVLCVYNKKDKYHRIMQDLNIANGNKVHASFLAKFGVGGDRNASSSNRESLYRASEENEEENNHSLICRTTIGNGPPESVLEWTREGDSVLSNRSTSNQVFSRKHWHLVIC